MTVIRVDLHRFAYLRVVASCALLLVGVRAHAQTDPLSSWHDGAAKKAIVEFVQATTTQGSPKFVPPAERIATFDQDGTLWVEHSRYTQVVYCLERAPAVVIVKPELAKVEPFKTVLSGSREAMAKLSMQDLTLWKEKPNDPKNLFSVERVRCCCADGGHPASFRTSS